MIDQLLRRRYAIVASYVRYHGALIVGYNRSDHIAFTANDNYVLSHDYACTRE